MTQSGVGQIIMTQSKLFLFLKNTDAAELDLIRNYIALSDEAKRNIMEFPAPEHLPEGKRFSSFLLYAQRADYPMVGVGRNYASDAILSAAATSGSLHSRINRLLKELAVYRKDLSFADQLLLATDLLTEDNKLFYVLNKMERLLGPKVAPLLDEAKIAFHEILKQQKLN